MYTQTVKLLLRSHEGVHGKRPYVTSDRLQDSPSKLLLASFCERKENLTWGQESLKAFFHAPLHMKTMTVSHKQRYLRMQCTLYTNTSIWWIRLYSKQEWQLKWVLKQKLGKASFNSHQQSFFIIIAHSETCHEQVRAVISYSLNKRKLSIVTNISKSEWLRVGSGMGADVDSCLAGFKVAPYSFTTARVLRMTAQVICVHSKENVSVFHYFTPSTWAEKAKLTVNFLAFP